MRAPKPHRAAQQPTGLPHRAARGWTGLPHRAARGATGLPHRAARGATGLPRLAAVVTEVRARVAPLPRLAVAVAIATAAPAAATTGGPLDAPAASQATASAATAFTAAAPPATRSTAAAPTATASPAVAPPGTESPATRSPGTAPPGAPPPGSVPPGAPPPGSVPPGSPSPGGLARGRELFDRACVSCHGQRGEGTQLGPDLTRAGAASADFQLSTGRMPLPAPGAVPRRGTPAFSRSDIDALTAYVASLGHGPAIPSVPAGDPSQGRRLYLATCAACHSSTGEGASLPGGQVAPSLLPSRATQIAEAVRLGPGAMPAFPPTELSDAQLGAVIAYLEGLHAEKAHGGAPLGGIGPVAEGAVAWLIGLGLLIVFIRFVGKKAP